ncbi:unnamed protein product [Parnassius apollo]|uniref:(apollo) hypothetical protein n=1 Tax=Parnassius apollo TaxID=110799 RepID=A0A8S3WRB9_PARAO|nr:unnamed protein product [Parnassius apollo]
MELKHELSTLSLLKLISFLFWSGLYLQWAVDSEHSPEYSSRVVTLLHGLVASCVGLAQCGVKTFSPSCLTLTLTWSQYALMTWSWGYFAFDLLWCLIYWTKNYTMMCHHFSALAAINLYISKQNGGCIFACTIALLEITNPLLQTRWFLRDAGHSNTILYYVVEFTYLIMFISLRGFLGTYLVYKIIKSETFGVYEKLITFALYFVSLIFIYEIFGYVLHKYRYKIEEFRGFGNEPVFTLQEQE